MALISRLAIRRAAPLRALTRAFSTQHVGGVEIIGVETGTQPAVSRITLVAKAGSRHETTPGVAHVLKNFAFKVSVQVVPRGAVTESSDHHQQFRSEKSTGE